MQLKKLAGQTTIYGLSVILGRLLNYLLVPIYTPFLETGEFGNFTNFYAWAPLLFIVYTLGMETTYFRLASRPELDENRVFNTIFSTLIISTITLSLLLLPLLYHFGPMLGFASSDRIATVFILIIAVDNLSILHLARLRQRNRSLMFSGIRLATILLTISLNILYVVFRHRVPFLQGLQEEAIFFINLFSNFIQLAFLLFFVRPYRFSISFALLPRILKYGLPIMVMGVPATLNNNFSRMFLDRLIPQGYYPGLEGREVLGIYGAAFSLSVIMMLVVQAYRYAAEPFFFSNTDHPGFRQNVARAMDYFVLIGCLIFLGVSLNLDFAYLFLRDEKFLQAVDAVPVLLMANLSLGIYSSLSIWFKVTDRTSYAIIFTTVGALLTIALNIYLIPRWGYMGAAYASLFSFGAMAISCYIIGQRKFPIPYNLGRAIFYIGLAMVLYLFISSFEEKIWTGFVAPLAYLFVVVSVNPNLRRQLKRMAYGNKSN